MCFRPIWRLLGGFSMNLPIIKLGGSDDAGMYSYFPMKCMQLADYFVRIRQVSSKANSRVSSRRTFHEFGQNDVNRGHNLEI